MAFKNIISLEEWGRALVPEKFRPHISEYLLKAGIKQVNYRFFGALFFITLAIAIGIYFAFVYSFLSSRATDMIGTLVNLGLGSFIFLFVSMTALSFLVMFAVYFYIDLMIYQRTKEIERILPEFLQYVASNLKGGMSFDRALWSAIKPRFGVLSTEIEIAAKRVMTGEDVDVALKEFTQMYDSPMLRRSFDLIIEGMRGGGRVVYLIDKVIENINESQTLKKEMAASVTSYVIFISFIVIFVAPALFALSYQLLIIVNSFAGKIGDTAGANLPISFSNVSINPDDFSNFSFMAIGIISTFSSMIVSIIRRGDIKGGLKFVPVFLVLAILDYHVFMKILEGAFSFLV
ncbi:MAG: type II secretion system F family protein [Candidatus Woesearchaeota archaeon]